MIYNTIHDTTIQLCIHVQLFFIIIKKNQIKKLFCWKNYYINCLKYEKRLEIDYKREWDII